jgi:predicted Fe-S protein YdhL (DUF1289 family)
MASQKQSPVSKLPSPCISLCQMDLADGVCLGCYRTRAEIASWPCMDETDQLNLLDILSERRAAATGAKRRQRRTERRLVL